MELKPKMSMIEGNTSSLVALRVMCYYCFGNNSRTVRLISLASGQRKIRRKFRRISMHLLLVVGDGGTYLSQSFPLFFPFSRFHSTYHMVYTVHFENWSELNDTRCGRLATNGLSLANSNPSSTIKAQTAGREHAPALQLYIKEAWLIAQNENVFNMHSNKNCDFEGIY